MKQFIYGFFIIFISLFLIPDNHTHAAQTDKSYSIEQLDILARINDNGDIEVREYFIYHFDGEFSTVTRTIGDDNHDGIKEFHAFEFPIERYNGENPDMPLQELSSEKKDETFHISRPAQDETVIFYYEYTIKNGIAKFNDTSEFYWRFFDANNNSNIHNIFIDIHLNEDADNREDFTYGTVHDWNRGISKTENNNFTYSNEFLPAGELLEVRLLFPSTFSSNMPYTAKKDKLDKFLDEEKKLEKRMVLKEKALPIINVIDAGFAYLALLLIVAGIIIRLFYLSRRIKAASIHDLTLIDSFTLIFIQKNKKVNARFLYAALFSLHQKGILSLHLNGKEEETFVFELNENDIELKENEQFLIDWLFKECSEGIRQFSLKDIPQKNNEDTTEEEINAKIFALEYQNWTKLIKKDYKTSTYFTNFKLHKWMMYMIFPILIIWGAIQLYIFDYKTGIFFIIFMMTLFFGIYAFILVLQYYSMYIYIYMVILHCCIFLRGDIYKHTTLRNLL